MWTAFTAAEGVAFGVAVSMSEWSNKDADSFVEDPGIRALELGYTFGVEGCILTISRLALPDEGGGTEAILFQLFA
ncbi:unnamed protein product [Echinostoma caproni]|uniref:Ketoacyl_synth_N domain-containing protein n=1 Tax=Echinostoma caproni TaxID=27848 RepID=A0A183BD14_9TREM|nr:unnamed protein product [Echinostoma caproni]